MSLSKSLCENMTKTLKHKCYKICLYIIINTQPRLYHFICITRFVIEYAMSTCAIIILYFKRGMTGVNILIDTKFS